MRNFIRFSVVATMALGLLVTTLPSSAQAFDSTQAKCRATVAKGGGKYSKTVLKALTGCHKSRDKDGSLSGTDCNDIAAADFKTKVPGAASKFDSGVVKKCTGVTPSDVLFDACPAPCAATVPVISTFSHVASCLTCLTDANNESFSDATNGTPASPIADSAEASCHKAITKNGAKLFDGVLKAVTKCQSKEEKAGSETITKCTVTDFNTLTQSAYDKAFDGIAKGCADVTLPSGTLDACGGALTVFGLAACVADDARSDAQALVVQYLELPAAVVTTTTTTTTTTSTTTTTLVGDPQCPDVGELVLYSRMSNEVCSINADCTAPRTCDAGRCTTVADLDSGWTGLSHNADINDDVKTRAHLYCPGPAGPTCGGCQVTGIDPTPGNCRCANDIRTYCDQPFQADNDDCGGATCDCYFGTPFPLNSAGTHVCLVNRFAENISGTANVDAGSGEITAKLSTRVYSGYIAKQPCPVCGGKCSDTMAACIFDSDCTSNDCVQDTPGDLVRDGLCIEGPNDGESCDVNGFNASFPSVEGDTVAGNGGAGYSLDCQPESGANISGSGLKITLNQTTGSVSLPATNDCDAGGVGSDLCPCMECSGTPGTPCANDGDCSAVAGACSVPKLVGSFACISDTDCASVDIGNCTFSGNTKCSNAPTIACSVNADCKFQDIGPCLTSTCSSKGSGAGVFPKPNQCNGGLCSDLGGGEGECTTGPDDKQCDGLLRADGSAMIGCNTNADCTTGVNYGACTLLTRRPCFLDPIEATGAADPEFPVAVSAFCVPGLASSAVNTVAGLPGPGRVISQGSAKTWCASDHGTQYTPGVGGCP